MSGDSAKLNRTIRLNIDFVLTDEAREILSLQDRVFLRKKAGESMHHVVMKLLSFFLFYQEGLEIEKPIGQHYKPDVVKIDEDGMPVVWIDCGATTIRKLEKIIAKNRHAEFVIVKPTERALESYRREAIRRIESDRLRYVTFSGHFVDTIAGQLEGRHDLHVVISEETLYLECDEETFQCEIVTLSGELGQ